MKTLELIGGMSSDSTALYYKWINEGVRDAMGPLHSAPLLLYSYDFELVNAMQHAGAQAIILCTNTMHKLPPQVEVAVPIPFLHLADCTAAAIQSAGHRKVALLGTKFTMQEEFYKGRLQAAGLDVIVPSPSVIETINRLISDELSVGNVRGESRLTYKQIISTMAHRGAQAVILGCTEITMMISQDDVEIPTYDTWQFMRRQR
jgi:aspartate racemase